VLATITISSLETLPIIQGVLAIAIREQIFIEEEIIMANLYWPEANLYFGGELGEGISTIGLNYAISDIRIFRNGVPYLSKGMTSIRIVNSYRSRKL